MFQLSRLGVQYFVLARDIAPYSHDCVALISVLPHASVTNKVVLGSMERCSGLNLFGLSSTVHSPRHAYMEMAVHRFVAVCCLVNSTQPHATRTHNTHMRTTYTRTQTDTCTFTQSQSNTGRPILVMNRHLPVHIIVNRDCIIHTCTGWSCHVATLCTVWVFCVRSLAAVVGLF